MWFPTCRIVVLLSSTLDTVTSVASTSEEVLVYVTLHDSKCSVDEPTDRTAGSKVNAATLVTTAVGEEVEVKVTPTTDSVSRVTLAEATSSKSPSVTNELFVTTMVQFDKAELLPNTIASLPTNVIAATVREKSTTDANNVTIDEFASK